MHREEALCFAKLREEALFFGKEPYRRDYILQKRPIILRSLLSK